MLLGHMAFPMYLEGEVKENIEGGLHGTLKEKVMEIGIKGESKPNGPLRKAKK